MHVCRKKKKKDSFFSFSFLKKRKELGCHTAKRKMVGRNFVCNSEKWQELMIPSLFVLEISVHRCPDYLLLQFVSGEVAMDFSTGDLSIPCSIGWDKDGLFIVSTFLHLNTHSPSFHSTMCQFLTLGQGGLPPKKKKSFQLLLCISSIYLIIKKKKVLFILFYFIFFLIY